MTCSATYATSVPASQSCDEKPEQIVLYRAGTTRWQISGVSNCRRGAVQPRPRHNGLDATDCRRRLEIGTSRRGFLGLTRMSGPFSLHSIRLYLRQIGIDAFRASFRLPPALGPCVSPARFVTLPGMLNNPLHGSVAASAQRRGAYGRLPAWVVVFRSAANRHFFLGVRYKLNVRVFIRPEL
jgi:hypothetical protein